MHPHVSSRDGAAVDCPGRARSTAVHGRCIKGWLADRVDVVSVCLGLVSSSWSSSSPSLSKENRQNWRTAAGGGHGNREPSGRRPTSSVFSVHGARSVGRSLRPSTPQCLGPESRVPSAAVALESPSFQHNTSGRCLDHCDRFVFFPLLHSICRPIGSLISWSLASSFASPLSSSNSSRVSLETLRRRPTLTDTFSFVLQSV